MRLPTRKKERENQLKGDDGPVFLTADGLEKLQNQIERLEKIDLPQAIKDVQTTGEFGDFSENAEYQEAKHRMRAISSRITILKERLKQVVMIKKSSDDRDRVQLGSTVTVEINGESQPKADQPPAKKTFEIVGPQEANPLCGRISHVSPLGSALIGHEVNDDVQLKNTHGEFVFKIIEIR